MTIRRLTKPSEVVAAIGRDRVYEITGKRSQNVTNWIAAGFFPPETYVVMQIELQRIRCSAPARLWRMIGPRRAARAA